LIRQLIKLSEFVQKSLLIFMIPLIVTIGQDLILFIVAITLGLDYQMALLFLTFYCFVFSLLFSLGYLVFAIFDVFPHPMIPYILFFAIILSGVFYWIFGNNPLSSMSIWLIWILINTLLLNIFIKPFYKH